MVFVDHESVDQKCTDLSEEYRRNILRVLRRQVKEYTLSTTFSCDKSQTAMELLVGISGLGVSMYLIDEEYERADIVTGHNKVTYEVDDHATDTFRRTK